MSIFEAIQQGMATGQSIAKPFVDAATAANASEEARRAALITMAANRMLPKGMTIDMGGGMSFGNKPLDAVNPSYSTVTDESTGKMYLLDNTTGKLKAATPEEAATVASQAPATTAPSGDTSLSIPGQAMPSNLGFGVKPSPLGLGVAPAQNILGMGAASAPIKTFQADRMTAMGTPSAMSSQPVVTPSTGATGQLTGKTTKPTLTGEFDFVPKSEVDRLTELSNKNGVPVANTMTEKGYTEVNAAKGQWKMKRPGTITEKEKFDYQKQQDDIDNKYKAETLELNRKNFNAAKTAKDKEITNITKILVKTSKEIDDNKVFKAVAQKAIDISTAEAELKVNLGSARGFIIRALAKSSGEQRITEEDAKAFSGNQALNRKIEQNWESIVSGKFTDFNQQEALEMIAIAKGVASKMAHSVVDSTYDNYDLGYAVKVPSDEFRANKHRYVDTIMGIKSQPTAPSGGTTHKSPSGKTYKLPY